MPTTNTLTGTVAHAGSGASVLPMMAPVAKITAAFAPARACAVASRKTLERVILSMAGVGINFF